MSAPMMTAGRLRPRRAASPSGGLLSAIAGVVQVTGAQWLAAREAGWLGGDRSRLCVGALGGQYQLAALGDAQAVLPSVVLDDELRLLPHELSARNARHGPGGFRGRVAVLRIV